MTAVEWLIDSIEGLEKSWVENIIDTDEYFTNIEWVKIKAKEMEKQQIIDAFNQGFREGETETMVADTQKDVAEYDDAINYYNETYKK